MFMMQEMRTIAFFVLITFSAVLAKNGILAGSGSEGDPWQVADYNDLKQIGTGAYALTAHYALVADIDASGSAWTAIGSKTAFSGFIDGQNHHILKLRNVLLDVALSAEIKNLFLDSILSPASGLITSSINCSIKNVHINGVAGFCTNEYNLGCSDMGGVIGEARESVLDNVSFEGTVYGRDDVGGLIGSSFQSAIFNSFSRGSIYASGDYAGGISGSVYEGLVGRSHFEGSIVAGYDAPMDIEHNSFEYYGGLIGSNQGGGISFSYAIADMSYYGKPHAKDFFPGDDYRSAPYSGSWGGLVGKNMKNGTIQYCYAIGAVSGTDAIGGLVGQNLGSIENSYAIVSVRADVSRKGIAGGLVAIDSGEIENSYATGKILSGYTIGGLAGESKLDFTENSYWNKDLTGATQSALGTGLSTDEMLHKINFKNWDFDSVWSIKEGEALPTLKYKGLMPVDSGYAFLLAEATASSKWTIAPIVKAASTPLSGYSLVGKYSGRPSMNPTNDSIYFPYRIGETSGLDTLWGAYSYMAVPKRIEISSYQELKKIGHDFAYPLFADYDLMADIDASVSRTENCIGVDCGGFIPIGSEYEPFTGNFDGNGHVIKNLYINKRSVFYKDMPANYSGLFGLVYFATIKNLILDKDSIWGGTWYSGALAGAATRANIFRVQARNSFVMGIQSVGGLIGEAYPADIAESAYDGFVKGEENVGGIVGCTGYNHISDSYARARIIGLNFVGGIAGYYRKTDLSTSYSASVITNTTYAYAGGLIGGGVADRADGITCTSCYFDKNLFAKTKSDFAKLTEDMLKQETFVNWNFDTVWTIREGETYPYLKYFNYASDTGSVKGDSITWVFSGNGTQESPYLIATYSDLKCVGRCGYSLNAYYKVIASIDAAASKKENCDSTGKNCKGFLPIGSLQNDFDGNFDGNNHIIKNLMINRPDEDSIGLFKATRGELAVKNLGLDSVSVVGRNYVGAVAGYMSGDSLKKAFSNGDVEGFSVIGGLVGEIQNAAVVNAYSTARVKGDSVVGALVARAFSSSVKDAYSAGKVTAAKIAGGLIAVMQDTKDTSDYWDYETTGLMASASGFPYSTYRMTKKETFSSWNFNDVWGITPDSTYPYFLSMKNAVYPAFVDSSRLTIAGAGTLDNPFVIKTYEDLTSIGYDKYVLSAHYILANDIDASLSGTEAFEGIKNYKGFIPIGLVDGKRFSGTFDGNGHVILNLYAYKGLGNSSLFVVLDSAAKIYNFTLKSTKAFDRWPVSICDTNYGHIRDVHLVDSLYKDSLAYYSSFAKFNYGTLANVSLYGRVLPSEGFITKDNYGVIDSAFFEGLTSANTIGVISEVNRGIIRNVNVKLDSGSTVNQGMGAIVGENDGTISAVYVSGFMNGSALAGVACTNKGIIDSCVIRLKISGNALSGIVNVNDTGAVVSNVLFVGTIKGIGGLSLIYSNRTATVRNVRLDSSEIEGNEVSGCVYSNDGGIIRNVTVSSSRLLADMVAGGLVYSNSGIIDSAQVKNTIIDALFAFGGAVYKNNASAKMSNVHVKNVAIVRGSYGGGFADENHGLIERSFSVGSIAFDDSSLIPVVGGFVGQNSGTIRKSYASTKIRLSTHGLRAGFVGENSGDISDSYSVDDDFSFNTTGFISRNKGQVSRVFALSYNNPDMQDAMGCFILENKADSLVADSYWNGDICLDSIWQKNKLTSAQMQNKASFAEWNFDSVWNIVPGKSYPYLRDMPNLPFAMNDSLVYSEGRTVAQITKDLLSNDYAYGNDSVSLLIVYDSLSEAKLDSIAKLKAPPFGERAFDIHYQILGVLGLDTLYGSFGVSQILFDKTARVSTKIYPFSKMRLLDAGQNFAELTFTLPGLGYASLLLFDSRGRNIKTYSLGTRDGGSYTERIDTEEFPSGRYFVALKWNQAIKDRIPLMIK